MEQKNHNLQLPAVGNNEEMEINLAELLSYFLSKWYLLAAGFLVGAVIAGLYTYFMITPKFTATSKLYMVSNSSDTIVDLSDFNIGNSLSADYEQLLRVRPVIEGVIEEEDLPYSYEQLRGMINVSTISGTRILQISATSTSPNEAMTIANALADKAVEEIPVLMDTAKPNIAERAITPTHKSSPSMSRNTVMGALLGLIAVAGILTILFLMNDTMVSAEDVQRKLGVMPMTSIPEGELSSLYDVEHARRSHRRRHSRRNRK